MKLVYERFETLQKQVDALARGTNPIVYFPPFTRKYPLLPKNASFAVIEGEGLGAGMYYFWPEYTSKEKIQKAISDGSIGRVLGYVMPKEVIAHGSPAAVVARDADGVEVKSAAVDFNNKHATFLQVLLLKKWFPFANVQVESLPKVIQERIA